MRVEDSAERGEHRVERKRKQEQVEIGKEPREAYGVERVTVRLAQQTLDAPTVVLAVGLAEIGLGPEKGPYFAAFGKLQAYLVSAPDNPRRLVADALALHALDLDRRLEWGEDLFGQETGNRLWFYGLADRRIGRSHPLAQLTNLNAADQKRNRRAVAEPDGSSKAVTGRFDGSVFAVRQGRCPWPPGARPPTPAAPREQTAASRQGDHRRCLEAGRPVRPLRHRRQPLRHRRQRLRHRPQRPRHPPRSRP